MAKRVYSPLKWHGGKYYLAPKLVELASQVPHLHRVETHGGGLNFTLTADPENVSEVVNDTNFQLTNFWRVLQDRMLFVEFQRDCMATPFSQIEFFGSDPDDKIPKPFSTWGKIESAVAFFIRCRQSMAGRMKDFTPLTRNRLRRGMNAEASAWLSCVDGLPAVHERLSRVVILNEDANEVIRKQDGPSTLFYCDPPYPHETRATTDEYGEQEMTPEQHEQLLLTLSGIEGHFMLSGYESEMYGDFSVANKWSIKRFDLPNNSAGGKSKRRMTECVWTNFKVK